MATASAIRYEPIDRRKNLSIEEFRREYYRPGRPLVLEDAMDEWKAKSSWTFDFFRSTLGNRSIDTYRYEQGEYRPDNVHKMPMRAFIDNVLVKDWTSFPYYFRDNSTLFTDHPELSQDFSHPKYFFDWFRLFPASMRRPALRIFIGPKGAVTNLHQDVWGTHFWMAQIAGRKKWVVFSPDQRDFMFKHCWRVRPDNPDLDRFPLFEKTRGMECTIGPGDIIFLPSNWLHWVLSLDPTISITYNFMGPGCFRPCLAGYSRFLRSQARNAIRKRFAHATVKDQVQAM